MIQTYLIGSGRALFILPGGRFDQVTREPLPEEYARSNKTPKP